MTQASLHVEQIDCWTRDHLRPVTAADITRYAAATNSPIPPSAGAPPLFAYLVAQDAITEVILSVVGDFPRNRMLNGEMSLALHRAYAPGVTYRSRARARRIEQRGKGTALLVESVTESPSGEPMCEIVQTAYLLGVQTVQAAGDPAPVKEPSAPVGAPRTIVLHVDQDQPARFTAATGEDNPIHRDPIAARASGLPGIVLHGTCVLALVVDHLAAAIGVMATDLALLRARFAAPVTPGQDLRTLLQPLEGGRYGFTTIDESGVTVLSRGLVVPRSRERGPS